MYHLRLIKALSYTGLVSATKKAPDVFVEDKAIADDAVASGYFTLVEGDAAGEQQGVKYHLSKAQLEEMKFDDLKKLATAMGINISNIKKKADLVEAIAAEEVEPGEPTDEDGNEVDYGEETGSPTMVELQEK